jgi:aminoglycoside phosphotransferase
MRQPAGPVTHLAGRGYFADDPSAARARIAALAVSRAQAPAAFAPLSRRNARTWRVQWTTSHAEVVKLACGSTPAELRAAARWLSREIEVLRYLHHAGAVRHRVTDYGQEYPAYGQDHAAPMVTWATFEVVRGCRASVLVRADCHEQRQVLEVGLRILGRLAAQHRTPPGPVADLDPQDRAALDRPFRAPPADEGTRAVIADLAVARAQSPGLVACHGDASLHNILVSSAEVSLIDWACARTDLPSLDLAPLFVWLARHTPDRRGGRRLLAALDGAYAETAADPRLGLPAHIARVLLQWAAWRGPGYADAARQVTAARDAAEAVDVLWTRMQLLR